MTRIAHLLLAAITMALGAGCFSPLPARPSLLEHPALVPERFFEGETRGTGTLELFTGRRRSLQVQGHGRTEADGSFRLDQVVTFEDGAVEKRTWRLVRIDAHTYTGTLSEAAGPVTAERMGNRLSVRYLLRRPAVRVEQRLYLRPDGRTVLNLATITVAGIPWARLEEVITKGR